MKMKKLICLALAALMTASLLCGCGSSAKSSGSSMSYAEAPAMKAEAGMDMAAAEEVAYENAVMDSGAGQSQASLPESRKWIITVYLNTETEDLDSLLEALNQQMTELGGYLEDQSIRNGSRYDQRRYRSADLTIRVPADRVDEFTQAVSGVANVVSNRRELEDITLQYVSTESRMLALQTEEARLLELMEKAETMSDLLEIEARLTDVRYELESTTSQLRVYSNQVDYATIHLSVEEVQEYTPVEEETLWQRISGGFMSSLKSVGEGIVDFFVWVIVSLPYLVIWGAVLAVVIIIFKKKKIKLFRRKKKEEKGEES